MFDGTTALLGNAEVFTGKTNLRDRYDTVEGIVFADESGTLNVDHSPDGLNWDYTDTLAVVADAGDTFTYPLNAPFWRLRYVNDATPQTEFRLSASTQAAGDS